MKISIKEDERIDDLQYHGLKIIQDKTGFCFGIDSVILANFAKDIKEGSVVADLGTGTGILGLLVCAKTKVKKVIGIEIQPDVADMAQRSIKLNNLEDRFDIINENIRDIIDKNLICKNTIDTIITNPPYIELKDGVINQNNKKMISRHEKFASLQDFIRISAQLLKDRGTMYLVHKPERIVDIIYNLRNNKLEPKEIRLVYPSIGKQANLVLIKAVKGANKFLKVDAPLYIYNQENEYNEEIMKIYNNN